MDANKGCALCPDCFRCPAPDCLVQSGGMGRNVVHPRWLRTLHGLRLWKFQDMSITQASVVSGAHHRLLSKALSTWDIGLVEEVTR